MLGMAAHWREQRRTSTIASQGWYSYYIDYENDDKYDNLMIMTMCITMYENYTFSFQDCLVHFHFLIALIIWLWKWRWQVWRSIRNILFFPQHPGRARSSSTGQIDGEWSTHTRVIFNNTWSNVTDDYIWYVDVIVLLYIYLQLHSVGDILLQT